MIRCGDLSTAQPHRPSPRKTHHAEEDSLPGARRHRSPRRRLQYLIQSVQSPPTGPPRRRSGPAASFYLCDAGTGSAQSVCLALPGRRGPPAPAATRARRVSAGQHAGADGQHESVPLSTRGGQSGQLGGVRLHPALVRAPRVAVRSGQRWPRVQLWNHRLGRHRGVATRRGRPPALFCVGRCGPGVFEERKHTCANDRPSTTAARTPLIRRKVISPPPAVDFMGPGC